MIWSRYRHTAHCAQTLLKSGGVRSIMTGTKACMVREMAGTKNYQLPPGSLKSELVGDGRPALAACKSNRGSLSLPNRSPHGSNQPKANHFERYFCTQFLSVQAQFAIYFPIYAYAKKAFVPEGEVVADQSGNISTSTTTPISLLIWGSREQHQKSGQLLLTRIPNTLTLTWFERLPTGATAHCGWRRPVAWRGWPNGCPHFIASM